VDCVTKDNEPRPITAAELAAERISQDPGLTAAAQRAQAAVANLNRNALIDATPAERAAAERYHRVRSASGLEPVSAELYALMRIVDDCRVPPEHRAIARAELTRREAEFERLLAEDLS
jgi:hypothetical protein